MGVIVLLIVFFVGWTADRWRTGIAAMVPIAGALTLLCFVTTNNPSFTEIEQDLSFTLQSVALNFLVKLASLWIAFSSGHFARRGLAIARCWNIGRHDAAAAVSAGPSQS